MLCVSCSEHIGCRASRAPAPLESTRLIGPRCNLQVLKEYDAEENGTVGPPRPAFQNESLADTAERFRRYLRGFSQAPWTIQRLCEVLLAPRKQYRKLHKVRVPMIVQFGQQMVRKLWQGHLCVVMT